VGQAAVSYHILEVEKDVLGDDEQEQLQKTCECAIGETIEGSIC
jgi:hypothetical protein